MDEKMLLITLLKEAVEKCYVNDISLIERSMEQACVARIFFYMQCLIYHDDRFIIFRNLSLDCEYNKNGQHIKETPRCPKGTRPDLVLHERKENRNNKLVVEFKSRKCSYRIYRATGHKMDIVKLEDFTTQGIYNYSLGVFVKLNKRKPKYMFFENGEITERFDENNDEIESANTRALS